MKKNDKLIVVQDFGLIDKEGRALPKQNGVVTVRKVRLYEKIGWYVSLMEFEEDLFFPADAFKKPDYDFVDDLIENL